MAGVRCVEPDTQARPKRSVSQLKQYEGCPYCYKLTRIEKAPQKPAAWFPQGSAFHDAAEAYEKSGRTLSLEQVEEVFIESYAKHINELADKVPNFNYWFRSGGYRRTVEEDIERRFDMGIEQVRRYVGYVELHPDEVPWKGPEGLLGIELPFEIEIGSVPVRGYIDQIVWDPVRKQWVVRDLKTGKSPGDETQLLTYAIAMRETHGLVIKLGDYWMARTGKPTIHYDLSDLALEHELSERFVEMDQSVLAEKFEPTPDPDTCKTCPVNQHCEFRAVDSF